MKKIYKGLMSIGLCIIMLSLGILFFRMYTSSEEKIEKQVVIEKQVEENNEEVKVKLEEEIIDTENESVDTKRAYRTNIIGNNEDKFTLMIYMCGSDLESEYGAASVDIREMLESNIGENINILIETGGTSDWTNESISEERNQIYKIEDNELVLVKDDLGLRNMAESSTLKDFITYSTKNYPANRYGLIVWNHGFGTIEGFGRDENFEGDNMELSDMTKALEESDVFFDFIGFDACFMSTIEVAYNLKDFSDYLIASSEIEPFAGWYYSNWITELSNNTSISTEELGKIIIDDFVQHNSNREIPEKAVLAITDLTEIEYVYENLCDFFTEINIELNNKNYDKVSLARSEAKNFADNLVDHIDAISIAEKLNLNSSQELIESINKAVKYKSFTSNMEEVGGLSIYFPYYKIDYFNEFKDAFNNLNLNDDHYRFINEIVSDISEGKISIIGTAREFTSEHKSKDSIANRYN